MTVPVSTLPPLPVLADAPRPATPETDVLVDVATDERLDDPWRVILYNDDIHSFDEVILQLVKATGCTPARAEELAWRVHTQGKAAVFEGSFEDCFRVQGVLREIQLVTEIEG
ncbi:MAG: ATP-dependent Clp protease adaptor ClpS [Bacteroidetes bacterium]|nr:Clp protease ClpS [Rhodothermaceae bacterium RA]RMH52395.1 MAG: ATP-dependent Clp protease adaptor ClpS [Bacteroidota bacterium]